jgi:hypothetical protein
MSSMKSCSRSSVPTGRRCYWQKTICPHLAVDEDRTGNARSETGGTCGIADRSRQPRVIDTRGPASLEDLGGEAARVPRHSGTDAEGCFGAYEIHVVGDADGDGSVGLEALDEHAGRVQDGCNLASDSREELF